MDNAGENIYIKQAIRSDPVLCEMGTVVEYIAPYIPQRNGKVEQAFSTLFSSARASCNGAKLPTTSRRNYSMRPSKTRFRRMLFCIHEVETWDLCIMFFSEKMHLM